MRAFHSRPVPAEYYRRVLVSRTTILASGWNSQCGPCPYPQTTVYSFVIVFSWSDVKQQYNIFCGILVSGKASFFFPFLKEIVPLKRENGRLGQTIPFCRKLLYIIIYFFLFFRLEQFMVHPSTISESGEMRLWTKVREAFDVFIRVHHICLYISLLSLHDYDVKAPNSPLAYLP